MNILSVTLVNAILARSFSGWVSKNKKALIPWPKYTKIIIFYGFFQLTVIDDAVTENGPIRYALTRTFVLQAKALFGM